MNHIIFEPPETLMLLSKMEDARLYLDGPYRQIPVGLGDRVVCSLSDEPLHVLGLSQRRLTALSPARALTKGSEKSAGLRKKTRKKAVD